MMQVVIDIPDSLYGAINAVRRMEDSEDSVVTNLLFDAVISGTVLPKVHGRLIDADELEESKEIMNTISGESKYAVRMDDIRNAHTIIAADKGE